jgi:hypothetical protein
MAQPTAYDRQFNFANQQALTPATPLPAAQVDAELNAIKVTLDQVLSNLAVIQRDDGALRNNSVSRETLNEDVTLGFGAPETWDTETSYTADFDTVFWDSKFYECAISHVSSDDQIDGFAADLALNYWTEIADFSASAVQGLGTLSTQDFDDVEITGGIMSGVVVTVDTPSASGHAVNKSYVDTAESDANGYTDDEITDIATTLRGELNAPTGTLMLFQQTSAPTGWTKETTHNDKALRVVSGTASSGGSSAFSTVFGKTATDSHTLAVTQIPSHDHGGATGAGGAHNHTYDKFADNGSGAYQNGPFGGQLAGDNASTNTSTSATHTHTIAAQGGGQGHTHNIDLRVHYVDIIIASKN